MSDNYSIETILELQKSFDAQQLHRPIRINRYEAGDELTYQLDVVETDEKITATVKIEKFIGGGYAGQVYRIQVLNVEGDIPGLETGGTYALKILIPPSGFAKLFRDSLYWIGFQGPFQQQVNPTAAKAGALWQKFIRRAATIRFNDKNSVKNVYATFVDNTIGSCGELSDWTEGRTWRLEVDDHMDLLKMHSKGKAVDDSKLGSHEYRAKKKFMYDFVELLHDVGAHEFARQYEWSTCKSQPNALKRSDTEGNPSAGLIAIDFRAGLTLLPFLPMSPGDFKLIWQGLRRGSLVQFDRGDIEKLNSFVRLHEDKFADMKDMLKRLYEAEEAYRNSIPDITHNGLRLLYDAKLWSTIFSSAVTGWKVKNLVDDQNENKLRNSKFLTFIFCLLGFIPILGRAIRKFWAKPDWRKHYKSILSSWDYLSRAFKGKIAESLIKWHRKCRVGPEKAKKLFEKPAGYFRHLPLSILPSGLHRFLTDPQIFKDKLHFLFVRPFKLYFSSELREQWMREMVKDGKRKHILTDEDAETILSQLKEKYIQRYLISLVVHLMTLPLTQIVSVIVATIYWSKTGNEAGAVGILGLFQIIPVSPGSLARGLYAVGIAIYDRSFKDYNIAVFLSFFKYIGYLGFPIQMTYHYPALARFMASHWATEAVHVVPVFGERGALLEHWVFCAFYNWPLTIRRRIANRCKIRELQPARYWHIVPIAIIIAGLFTLADKLYMDKHQVLTSMKSVWYLILLLPVFCGSAVTIFAKGLVLWKRFVAATISGLLTGAFYTINTYYMASSAGLEQTLPDKWAFRVFFFAIFATVGAIITELKLPDPQFQPKK